MDKPFIFNPVINREPRGAVECGAAVTLRLYARDDIYLSSLTLVVVSDDDHAEQHYAAKFEAGGEYYSFAVTFSAQKRGLFWYYFLARQNDHTFYICGDEDMNARASADLKLGWQLTVYGDCCAPPKWMNGRTMYHVFVDRFARSRSFQSGKENAVLRDDWGGDPVYTPNTFGKILNNDFFCGNLRGIIEKLSYLESLGVGILYLSPIFQAASNHRYDTADYSKIDELLGSEEDFRELASKCAEKDIKIILDGVFNHTGDDSVYFNKYLRYNSIGAFNSKQSPYIDWYRFTEYPNKYDSWWGIDILPDTNQQSPSYRQFISGKGGIVEKWLKSGISGWRLDVVDELCDGFLDPLCQRVKETDESAVIIGEVWEDASNKSSYGVRRRYFQGGQLDSVMNYPIKEATISFIKTGNSKFFVREINNIIDHYPKHVLDNLMNILSTHDTARILTLLADCPYPQSRKERAAARLSESERNGAICKLKLASLLQFTIFGVPCIYYGDEVGVEGYEDPFNRRCFPWGGENGELLEWYRFLGGLRRENPSLTDGDFRFVKITDHAVLYSRGKDELIVGVNMGETSVPFSIDGEYTDLITGKHVAEEEISPRSFVILKKAY